MGGGGGEVNGQFLENITVVAILLALSSLLFYGIALWARRVTPRRPGGAKEDVYACGEEMPAEKAYVLSGKLYDGFWRGTFRAAFEALRGSHSGILDDWLWWAMVVLAVLFVVFYAVM
ncbi:MAG: hypothetical protein QXU06_01525 [Candidatus Bathyarchaeia archaeon]